MQSRRRSCENGNSCPGCGLVRAQGWGAGCGAGYGETYRQRGGSETTLTPKEFKTCNPEACPEVRRNTPWTPWLPVNVTQGGARQEQRFRFTCRAPLPDPHGLQFGKRRTETRTCPADGSGACDTDGTASSGGAGGSQGGLGRRGKPNVRVAEPVALCSPGGGSPAQREHVPTHSKWRLGRLGPVVILLSGLRAGLPCPQENLYQPGAPQRRLALRGRCCGVPRLQPAGLPR